MTARAHWVTRPAANDREIRFRLRFLSGDQRRGAAPVLAEAAHLGPDRVGDRLTAKVTDDRPQLGYRVEGQAVIDAPEPAVTPFQGVARLAVGVVGEDVEEGDPHQLLLVG